MAKENKMPRSFPIRCLIKQFRIKSNSLSESGSIGVHSTGSINLFLSQERVYFLIATLSCLDERLSIPQLSDEVFIPFYQIRLHDLKV